MTGEEWSGLEGRRCGEHRTVGGRAWCYDCSEWCYPDAPCVRCELPALEAEVEALKAKNKEWLSLTPFKLRRMLGENEQLKEYKALADELVEAWRPIQYIDTDSKLGQDWLARYEALPKMGSEG